MTCWLQLKPFRSTLTNLLSGVERNATSGRVESASALMNVWLLEDHGVKEDGQASVDKVAMDWENAFVEITVGEKVPEGLPEGANLLGIAERR